jgi:cytochrome b561
MDMSNVALIVEAVVVVLGTTGAIGWYVTRRASNKSGAADVPQSASSDGTSVSSSAAKYHPVHVLIHWFIAFAMAQLLLRGAFIMVNIPNSSPEKISALRAHMFAGSLVLVLMIIRVVLVNTARLPAPAKGPTPLLTRLKEMVHPLLYVSIFVQAFAGLGMAYQADLPSVIFLHHGALPASFWIYPLRTVHYVNSRILMVLIALHISGALYHTFVMRDGLIRRMSFGRRWIVARVAALPQRGRSVPGRERDKSAPYDKAHA